MTKCLKCQNEITKEDEQKGNYDESAITPGTYRHIRCPGVQGNSQADEWKKILAKDTRESEANPMSWIVKK